MKRALTGYICKAAPCLPNCAPDQYGLGTKHDLQSALCRSFAWLGIIQGGFWPLETAERPPSGESCTASLSKAFQACIEPPHGHAELSL